MIRFQNVSFILYFKYIFYGNLYFKYNLNTIWKLVQFYSHKRQICISSNPLGLRSTMDMPQFELIGKPMFDFLLVTSELFQFL